MNRNIHIKTTLIFILFLLGFRPSDSMSIGLKPSNGVCDSLHYIALFYTKVTKCAQTDSASFSRHYLGLGYKAGILRSWASELGGNLMTTGLIKPDFCRAIYPGGDTCAVGLWDGKSKCFVTGITENAHPSHLIRNFGGTNDIAFLIYNLTSKGEFRQILVYRPGVGALLSQIITPYHTEKGIQVEERLDSIVYEANGRSGKIANPTFPSQATLDTAAIWMRTIKYKDIKEGEIISVDWNFVRMKAKSLIEK